MDRAFLYHLLQPGSAEAAPRLWRGVHHAMVATGLGVMLALTVPQLRIDYGVWFSGAFYVIAAFFVGEYALRLYVAPDAPGGAQRGAFSARLAWAVSIGGVFDLFCGVPGPSAGFRRRGASLFALFSVVTHWGCVAGPALPPAAWHP